MRVGGVAAVLVAVAIACGTLIGEGARPARAIPNLFEVTNTNDAGPGSLRQAILDLNAETDLDSLHAIAFNLAGPGPHRIQLQTPLPPLVRRATIEGYTALAALPNTAEEGTNAVITVELDGSLLPRTCADQRLGSGLVFDGQPEGEVRGLAIVGFPCAGVLVAGGADVVIAGTFLGLRADGTTTAPNGTGVIVTGGAADIRIGGPELADRNLISGNAGDGLLLDGANGAIVEGNVIGLAANANTARGNAGRGIAAANAPGTRIGTTAGPNRVAGNGAAGVDVSGSAAGTLVQGNRIGTRADGSVLANGGGAIVVSSPLVLVGGPGPGEGNVVAGGPQAGVIVRQAQGGPAVSGVTIRGNAILPGDAPGIDLQGTAGVTANDAGDSDSGPNGLQNYPVLSAVIAGPGQVRLLGTLNSTANATFELDVYTAPSCSSAGRAGLTWVGTLLAATDASGNAPLDLVAFTPEVSGFLLLTATDSAGSTSEFSDCRAIRWSVDVNCDGQETLADAMTLLQGLAGLSAAHACAGTPAWDVDGSGVADADDVAYVMRALSQ